MVNFIEIVKTIVIFCVFLRQGFCYLDVKPTFLKTCSFADPDFTKCSTESIQGVFQELVTGIDGLEDLGTIDPLKIQKLQLFQGEGPVSVNASLRKITVTGLGHMEVIESKVSQKDFSWETKIRLPKMRLEGTYNMNGRILIIPLNGHGKCWFEPSNMDVLLSTKTKLYENGGHVFYNVTSTKVAYTIQGLKLRLNNLFEGVKALEESTNEYLNDNWKPVSESLKPIISRSIENILLGLLQQVFHSIPADFFISDIPRPSQNIISS